MDPKINDVRHPHYAVNELNWFKWRLTFRGGVEFLKKYLFRLSKREDDVDFSERRQLSYVPAFAKKAVWKVINSVFKRLGDVTRAGGPKSYEQACKGGDPRGVDLQGSTMTAFVGKYILPELVSMARVGVYVDMPQLPGPTVADKGNRRPYLYYYRAEDIRSWSPGPSGDPTEFTSLLLRDSAYDLTTKWALPYETLIRYRHVWLDATTGKVKVQFYGQGIDENGKEVWNPIEAEVTLDITRIPFVVFEISESLLADAADYQIALMNLSSTDIAYAMKSNFPFYTEQVDWRVESPHLKGGGIVPTVSSSFAPGQTTVMVNQDTIRQIQVGASGGRQYPVGADRPGFIHPSSEPLQVAMQKEDQMKREIEELVTNSLSSLQPTQVKGESVQGEGAEAGLQYIAIELEHGEREIAKIWAMYEGSAITPATIHYPNNFTLLTDEDRQAHATFLRELLPHIPSLTYQREIAKQIAVYTVGNRVDDKTLAAIQKEIDTSPVVYGDPKTIALDVENGLVSLETASKARGYPEGEVEKAKEDHAERLARIAAAQTPGQGYGSMSDSQARGVQDKGADPNAGKEEKKVTQRDKTKDPVPQDKTRGENA